MGFWIHPPGFPSHRADNCLHTTHIICESSPAILWLFKQASRPSPTCFGSHLQLELWDLHPQPLYHILSLLTWTLSFLQLLSHPFQHSQCWLRPGEDTPAPGMKLAWGSAQLFPTFRDPFWSCLLISSSRVYCSCVSQAEIHFLWKLESLPKHDPRK